MGLSGFTILLTLIEIGLLAGRRLNPVFHLTSACIKTVIWLVWFILNVASSAYVGSSSALDIVLSLIVAYVSTFPSLAAGEKEIEWLTTRNRICSIAQLIYGSIIVHRVRKGFYCNQNNVASSTCNVASSAGGYGYDNNIYSAEMDVYPRKNVSSDDSRV